MKKPILGMAVVLLAACSTGAQESGTVSASGRASENIVSFENTSAAQVNLLESDSTDSFRPSNPEPTASEPAAASPVPAPVPTPRFVFGDRDDYRWQLGLGVEFLRFRSSVLDASIVGVNTTVTYFTNSWFAAEGNVITAFGPPPNNNNHVKYFEGAGGFRIGGRRARFEPWGHALIGGSHLQPQTSKGSRNALSATGGGGLDFRVNSRLSLRAEVDYVYTRFWSEGQNNFQATAGVVFHF